MELVVQFQGDMMNQFYFGMITILMTHYNLIGNVAVTGVEFQIGRHICVEHRLCQRVLDAFAIDSLWQLDSWSSFAGYQVPRNCW